MNQDQTYQFGALSFSVAQARRILAAAPRGLHYVCPRKWAANFHLTENDPRIDHEYAMTQADLNIAVFVTVLETADGSEQMIIIDGCHRLYRAYHEARRAVPAYLFTKEETQRILTTGEIENVMAASDHADCSPPTSGCGPKAGTSTSPGATS